MLPDELTESPLCTIKIKASITLESVNQKTFDICLQGSGISTPNPNMATTTLTHLSHKAKQNLQRAEHRVPQKQDDFPGALTAMEKQSDCGGPSTGRGISRPFLWT